MTDLLIILPFWIVAMCLAARKFSEDAKREQMKIDCWRQDSERRLRKWLDGDRQ